MSAIEDKRFTHIIDSDLDSDCVSDTNLRRKMVLHWPQSTVDYDKLSSTDYEQMLDEHLNNKKYGFYDMMFNVVIINIAGFFIINSGQ